MDTDDERVRALLARAGEQPGPPLGFTSAAIARRGRRIRLVRWGVAGVVVVAAGVTVSMLLVSARPVQPASPPPPPPAATTTTTTTALLTTTTSHFDTQTYTTTR